MVTVTNYVIKKKDDGNEFIALMLESGLEFIQSGETGRFYATTRKCSIASSLSEVAASKLIGKELPGEIIQQSCDPYEYTITDTGEVIEMDYTWTFVPPKKAQTAEVNKTEVVTARPQEFSSNGTAQPV